MPCKQGVCCGCRIISSKNTLMRQYKDSGWNDGQIFFLWFDEDFKYLVWDLFLIWMKIVWFQCQTNLEKVNFEVEDQSSKKLVQQIMHTDD